ncbi:hypothetical protein [Sulfurimonas sp.]|uniref:hypothetical protein n=1 Tax=Sulfurimonas sp. TaxID=2022749 RepID=UPI002AB0CEDB|nr:hypothetical protein [Sulfurimonas sp.]
MNEIYSVNVKIYPELLKYKDDFGNAIKIYYDKVMVDENYENYVSESRKVSCRLKCVYSPDYYKNMIDTVKNMIQSMNKGEKKTTISDSVIMNNVLASLKDISCFN